jgi:hypothetical protein
MEKHEKLAILQQAYWKEHTPCYLPSMDRVQVSIDQLMLAKDEYVIRKLEKGIVESCKEELVNMMDTKQRQRICITPVDARNELLK